MPTRSDYTPFADWEFVWHRRVDRQLTVTVEYAHEPPKPVVPEPPKLRLKVRREFVKIMQEEGIEEAYIQALAKRCENNVGFMYKHSKELYGDAHKFTDFINWSFGWCTSPQGLDFWKRIYDKYQAKGN